MHNLKDFSRSINNNIVKDFLWVVSSPHLIDYSPDNIFLSEKESESFFPEAYFLDLIKRYDKNPEELIGFTESGNTHLLGKYFESLLEFAFIKSPVVTLIDCGRQIRTNSGQTIGELDFIIKHNETNRYYHIEAAGKFYISAYGDNNPEHFIGPNPADNLLKKYEHITNSQIRLTESEPAKDYLNSIGITKPVITKILFKGYLFHPFDNFLSGDFTSPDFINPAHCRGWYTKAGKVEKLQTLNPFFTILPRKEWMPPSRKSKNDILSFNELVDYSVRYFSDNDYPLLVAEYNYTDNYFLETSRGFIASDQWPSY